jgi:hypothetical protein
MNALCDDLIYNIISHINSYEDIYNILLVNKYYIAHFGQIYKHLYAEYCASIHQIYPIFIIKLFPNLASMRDLAKIEFSERFIGETGNIDKITLNDISENVTYCIDHHDNGFLILRLQFVIRRNRSDRRNLETVICIYQKPNRYYRWCIGSNEPYYGIMFNNIINYTDIVNIKNLLLGETIQFNSCEIKL